MGTAAAPYLNSLTNGIASPALRTAVQGVISGTVVGGVLGGGLTPFTGGNFWSNMGQGAATGAGTGGVSGLASGYMASTKANINPWTGKANPPAIIAGRAGNEVPTKLRTSLEIINTKLGESIKIDHTGVKTNQGAYPINSHSWMDFVKLLTNGTNINPKTGLPITGLPGSGANSINIHTQAASYTFYARDTNGNVGMLVKFHDTSWVYKYEFISN